MYLERTGLNQAALKKYHVSLPRLRRKEALIGNSQRFKDKVIVITGASSGIGKACAFKFQAQGQSEVFPPGGKGACL